MAGKKAPVVINRASAPEREHRGRVDRGVMFPVAAPVVEMPADYVDWLAGLKQRIRSERLRVVLAGNAAMVLLYWDIGRSILAKQAEQGYGTRVIDRLATDLREAFPEMKGFSPRNLKYMRAFAAAWPVQELVQEALAQATWYHNITLLEKLNTHEDRLWYAARTVEHGWSRNILAMQIETRAHLRHGKAQNNFPSTLPPEDSDMVEQIFKDPYQLDFLGTDAPRRCASNRPKRPSWMPPLLPISRNLAMAGKQAVDLKSQFVISSLGDSHRAVRCAVSPAPTFAGGLPWLAHAVKLRGVRYGG